MSELKNDLDHLFFAFFYSEFPETKMGEWANFDYVCIKNGLNPVVEFSSRKNEFNNCTEKVIDSHFNHLIKNGARLEYSVMGDNGGEFGYLCLKARLNPREEWEKRAERLKKLK